MAKPLHAGRAAETGLLAALLARGWVHPQPVHPRERLEAKFLALATPVLGRAGAEALGAAALGAHELRDAAELLRLARAG